MVKASPSKDYYKTEEDSESHQFRYKNMNVCVRISEQKQRGMKRTALNQVKKLKEKHELRTLYHQLKEVIPACKSKPVTSLDIVLRAVDYINELHGMLEKQQSPEATASDAAKKHNADFARQCTLIAANNARNLSFQDITNVTTCNEMRTTDRIL